MIGFLKGEILDQSDGRLLIATGSGVGYLVTVPQSASYLSLLPGKPAELFIHTHVREDALDLYGFLSRVEKELFVTLIGVNGIGPKVATAILSACEPEELVHAILGGDTVALTRIPGIGKKTAERVLLETSDKLRKRAEAGALPAGASKGASGAPGRPRDRAKAVLEDARSALVGLGYRDSEVSAVLNRLMADPANSPKAAEELVKSALREMI